MIFEYKLSKKAFTLAETLITLVIIGVIAAITVPILINRYNETQSITQLKNSYSIISNSFNQAIAHNGQVNTWSINSNISIENTTIMYNLIKPNLNIVKECGFAQEKSCFAPVYNRLNNSETTTGYDTDVYLYKTVLANGSSFALKVLYPNCNTSKGTNKFLQNICGIAYIDVNGTKKPNTNGRDLFEFWITKYGIYPRGSNFEDSESTSNLENSGGCKDKTTLGYGCSAWVLTKGNMDYLHHTVSW